MSSSSQKKKRSRGSNFSVKKKSKIVMNCGACGFSCCDQNRFKSHFKDNKSCRQSSLTFACSFCKYVGLNLFALDKHLNHQSSACKGLYNQLKTTEGYLPEVGADEICFDSTSVDDDGVVTTSYEIPRVAANRVVDSILIHLKDDTATVRKEILSHLEVYKKNLTTHMMNNRSLAGIYNNNHNPILKDSIKLTSVDSNEIELDFNPTDDDEAEFSDSDDDENSTSLTTSSLSGTDDIVNCDTITVNNVSGTANQAFVLPTIIDLTDEVNTTIQPGPTDYTNIQNELNASGNGSNSL